MCEMEQRSSSGESEEGGCVKRSSSGESEEGGCVKRSSTVVRVRREGV